MPTCWPTRSYRADSGLPVFPRPGDSCARATRPSSLARMRIALVTYSGSCVATPRLACKSSAPNRQSRIPWKRLCHSPLRFRLAGPPCSCSTLSGSSKSRRLGLSARRPGPGASARRRAPDSPRSWQTTIAANRRPPCQRLSRPAPPRLPRSTGDPRSRRC